MKTRKQTNLKPPAPAAAASPNPVTVNAAAGTVELKLDGRTYMLAYDFNAIVNAEAESGSNLFHAISAAIFMTETAAQLRGLFYALLQKYHPFVPGSKEKPESGVGLLKAGQMIRFDTMQHVHNAVSAALLLNAAKQNG